MSPEFRIIALMLSEYSIQSGYGVAIIFKNGTCYIKAGIHEQELSIELEKWPIKIAEFMMKKKLKPVEIPDSDD